jgi:hypothetical protein
MLLAQPDTAAANPNSIAKAPILAFHLISDMYRLQIPALLPKSAESATFAIGIGH